MVVLQEYVATDNQGLGVKRGEVVQVIKEEPNWFYVRNERHKEGYVPSNHLVAPYSSMRSRSRVLGVPNSVPMRHVASGSSIDIKEQQQHHHSTVVSMYPSTSAGRPRNHSMVDDNRIHPAGRQNFSSHELNGGGALLASQTVPATERYDQKCSPSTSSGVASFAGTGSPVGNSDGSNHSSFCSVEEDRESGRGEGGGGAGAGEPHNGHAYAGNDDAGRMKGVAGGRPPPPPSHTSYGNDNTSSSHQQDHQRNAFNSAAAASYVQNEAPPPLPPRTFYGGHAPQPPPLHGGDPYQEDPQGDDADSYASPADAISKQLSPHLGHPRVRSINDVRLRELQRSQENGVYSEVFQGHQRPPRQNGYRTTDDDNRSEGGSSRSRSSRKSGSRVSSLQTQTTPDTHPGYDSEVFSPQETSSEVTPNDVTHRPLSATSLNKLCPTKIKKFRRNLWGVYIVVMDFESEDENEVSICEGDHVSVWNQDDRDWYWIVKHDTSEEGFVPSARLKEFVSSPEAQLPQAPQGEGSIE